ncbi:MAG TPA: ABC transporter ATP-binding protein [Terriglobales bacterium]|nr:ABC transporter ATP-binding protein [Terriglobales bacterium]
MAETVIHFENVWKKFKRGEQFDSLRDLVPTLAHSLFSKQVRSQLGKREFWALQDVSFEVVKGQTIGIIGRNGSGKSTTLKLLSNILKPTRGMLRVNGKISALIEIGAGFHPDLTGRENIYLNGAILGMTHKHIERHFDRIVEFSELADFIDTPVKRYSSGMFARLGFSVAAHLESDILLVDEVLSVGDVGFQMKCMDRIRDLQRRGTTIVFVSHNMDSVLSICDTVVHLDRSIVRAIGPAPEVVREYHRGFRSEVAHPEHEHLPVVIRKVSFKNGEGESRYTFERGETVSFQITVHAKERIPSPVLGIAIYHENGTCVYGHNTRTDGWEIEDLEGEHEFEIKYDPLPLQPGRYLVSVAVYESLGTRAYVYDDRAYDFTITGKSGETGVTFFPHSYAHNIPLSPVLRKR